MANSQNAAIVAFEGDTIWAATWQNQQSDCAPSEGSDQPGHPPSLIRVFAVRMKKALVLSYPLSAQWGLWSDWADAQADLRWAHSHFVGFVMSRLISIIRVLDVTIWELKQIVKRPNLAYKDQTFRFHVLKTHRSVNLQFESNFFHRNFIKVHCSTHRKRLKLRMFPCWYFRSFVHCGCLRKRRKLGKVRCSKFWLYFGCLFSVKIIFKW